jgi:plastocyanin
MIILVLLILLFFNIYIKKIPNNFYIFILLLVLIINELYFYKKIEPFKEEEAPAAEHLELGVTIEQDDSNSTTRTTTPAPTEPPYNLEIVLSSNNLNPKKNFTIIQGNTVKWVHKEDPDSNYNIVIFVLEHDGDKKYLDVKTGDSQYHKFDTEGDISYKGMYPSPLKYLNIESGIITVIPASTTQSLASAEHQEHGVTNKQDDSNSTTSTTSTTRTTTPTEPPYNLEIVLSSNNPNPHTQNFTIIQGNTVKWVWKEANKQTDISLVMIEIGATSTRAGKYYPFYPQYPPIYYKFDTEGDIPYAVTYYVDGDHFEGESGIITVTTASTTPAVTTRTTTTPSPTESVLAEFNPLVVATTILSKPTTTTRTEKPSGTTKTLTTNLLGTTQAKTTNLSGTTQAKTTITLGNTQTRSTEQLDLGVAIEQDDSTSENSPIIDQVVTFMNCINKDTNSCYKIKNINDCNTNTNCNYNYQFNKCYPEKCAPITETIDSNWITPLDATPINPYISEPNNCVLKNYTNIYNTSSNQHIIGCYCKNKLKILDPTNYHDSPITIDTSIVENDLINDFINDQIKEFNSTKSLTINNYGLEYINDELKLYLFKNVFDPQTYEEDKCDIHNCKSTISETYGIQDKYIGMNNNLIIYSTNTQKCKPNPL